MTFAGIERDILKMLKDEKIVKASDLHIITFYGNHQDRSLNFK